MPEHLIYQQGKIVDVWAAGCLRAVFDSMHDAGRHWRRCHYTTMKNENNEQNK